MDYFVKKYFNIIKELENERQQLIIKKYKNNDNLYDDYLEKIDDLIFTYYIKIENILNNNKK